MMHCLRKLFEIEANNDVMLTEPAESQGKNDAVLMKPIEHYGKETQWNLLKI